MWRRCDLTNALVSAVGEQTWQLSFCLTCIHIFLLSFFFSFSHIEPIKARLCGIISAAKQRFLLSHIKWLDQHLVSIICTLEAVSSWCCLYEECEASIMLTWTDHFQRSDRIVSSRWQFVTDQLCSRNGSLLPFNPRWTYSKALLSSSHKVSSLSFFNKIIKVGKMQHFYEM